MSTDTTTAAAPSRWCGWFRGPGAPWRLLCQAGDYDSCLRQLMDGTRALPPGELIVLAAGTLPTPPRRTAARAP